MLLAVRMSASIISGSFDTFLSSPPLISNNISIINYLDLPDGRPVGLHRLGVSLVDAGGQVLVPAEVGLGLDAGVGLAGLVDGHHPELVPLPQAESGNARLQLLYRGRAVGVVGHEGVEPPAEGVLVGKLTESMFLKSYHLYIHRVPATLGRCFVFKFLHLPHHGVQLHNKWKDAAT